ncbi:MAG: MarR family transcriptional regulator [Actinomycetota bacterium]|nr:MarR family transcriptional regulator [Actinomycetota bacterium]
MTQYVTVASESSLATALSRAAGYAAQATELLNVCSLSLDRWRVLELVARQPGVTMSGLATQLGTPSSTATRIVDSLVSNGALHRVVDLADRRRVGLKITDRGQATVTEARQHLEPLETEIGKQLSEGRTSSSDNGGSQLNSPTTHLVRERYAHAVGA